MARKQTAGRDRLGHLAPTFAHLNDDVLFGEVWSREEALTARGYQCFVVDYRLSRDLGAIDLARATRFVRAHWQDYGLPHEDAIAVMGYSAGGIAAGQMLLDWDGTTSPALYDASYAPDELDVVVDEQVHAADVASRFLPRCSHRRCCARCSSRSAAS